MEHFVHVFDEGIITWYKAKKKFTNSIKWIRAHTSSLKLKVFEKYEFIHSPLTTWGPVLPLLKSGLPFGQKCAYFWSTPSLHSFGHISFLRSNYKTSYSVTFTIWFSLPSLPVSVWVRRFGKLVIKRSRWKLCYCCDMESPITQKKNPKKLGPSVHMYSRLPHVTPARRRRQPQSCGEKKKKTAALKPHRKQTLHGSVLWNIVCQPSLRTTNNSCEESKGKSVDSPLSGWAALNQQQKFNDS